MCMALATLRFPQEIVALVDVVKIGFVAARVLLVEYMLSVEVVDEVGLILVARLGVVILAVLLDVL